MHAALDAVIPGRARQLVHEPRAAMPKDVLTGCTTPGRIGDGSRARFFLLFLPLFVSLFPPLFSSFLLYAPSVIPA